MLDLRPKWLSKPSEAREPYREIAIEYGVPANQITKWKKQVIDELPSILAVETEKRERTAHDLIFKLYEEIAQLSGELGRVKKAEAGS